MTIDIALAIEAIIPAAQYSGSVTANTEESYNLVVWNDERMAKPTWEALEEAWQKLSIKLSISTQIAEIDAELQLLESASLRPNIAITNALVQGAKPNEEDIAKLAAIENKKIELRALRAQLT